MLRSTQVSKRFERGVAFLLAPRSTDPNTSSRELALHTIFLGTLCLTFGALIIVCANYFLLHLTYLLLRIAVISVVALALLGLYTMALRQRFTLPAYSLLVVYFIAATAACWLWGVEAPIGTLLFALVVIFAGILLGARYSLYAALLVVGIQMLFVALLHAGIAHPDKSWAATPARFYDVIVYAIILGNIALISWLFNRSMERSLARAQRSERALLRQKEMLEVTVEERTRQVQVAHLERTQELYRFAELGHMSVALLHDMANYLTVLSLDIEGLKQAQKNRSTAVRRVQESTRHLNSLIKQVRGQIQGETTITSFNIATEIDQVIKILEYKATAAQVQVMWQPAPDPSALAYTGKVNYFWQIIMNLISNGIDAYDGYASQHKTVAIRATRTASDIVISVTDFGKGIPANKHDKIFEPFYSTKKDGTGVGLAITKRMVEKDFGGTIALESSKEFGTIFTVTLPTKAD
ncbi:MAG TPA: HAMP domain-containing sensor histidine kinase [Candidatus Saccharimonadales bacterium]|nr:HAMP domain-containing sensor histidine kinase [Candidatus Saccharimonadales bacterium]